ncbi:hypothetical protein SDC9_159580 [bioreactor metagenome]|uniref:Uncharacterized protein n=1 Tax=bioreactor metagenome TaxID=1076179 RepID=A0A645FD02_9ZZZZ
MCINRSNYNIRCNNINIIKITFDNNIITSIRYDVAYLYTFLCIYSDFSVNTGYNNTIQLGISLYNN